jgi:poly(3-hydroxybutyrate) depolymerase
LVYQGCGIEFITVDDLGHHWAGGNGQAPEFLVRKNSKKLDATESIWRFFIEHPK